MTQAKIEPGDQKVSLDKDHEKRSKTEEQAEEENDVLPELGLKRPAKPKTGENKASPLDDGIDLGK